MNKKEAEMVVDFTMNLSREMIRSGANLERVQLAVRRICEVYRLMDVSLFLLSTDMSLAVRTEGGEYLSRQISIQAAGIHLEKLKVLNRMSYMVCEHRPKPEKLAGLLKEALQVEDYSDRMVLFGQIVGMCCLCLIFGGSLADVVSVILLTTVLHYILRVLQRPGIAHIISNALCMFIATTLAIFLCRIGIGRSFSVIMITEIMLVIPGIPLVNAVRNILCNNEMNGILQSAKVILETLSLVVGLYVSAYVFWGWIPW